MNVQPTLLFCLHDGSALTVELHPVDPLTLGRAEDNAVRLDDTQASRHHARVFLTEEGDCLIEDLQSSNGTILNGARLARPKALQDGDRLGFGHSVTAIYRASEADAARLPPVELVMGETFAGRYRFESSLGETTEYHAFLAADLLSEQQQRAALKVFLPGVIAQVGGLERAADEFARICAAPTHPHLAGLLEFGRWRGASFLAAEWIEGFSLLDLLRRRGGLAPAEAVRLTRQAATATDHARAHGLPAPDLEPRAALIAFDSPLATLDWERLLDAPLERWPASTLKISPRLFDSASTPPWPLGALICELLGHPRSAPGASRPARIANLGELGNEILAQGLESDGKAFEGDVAFIDALAQAAGVDKGG